MLLAQPLRQVVRHPLGQASGVHEDQRRLMLADQLRHPVIRVAPLRRRADRFQVCRWHLDRQVQVALVAGIDDGAVRLAIGRYGLAPHQEARRVVERLDRRRQPDARSSTAADVVQPRQGQREMAAALVAHQRVDLVDDHGLHVAQDLAAPLCRQHQIERFGRRDQNVGRMLDDLLAVMLRRVARPQHRADVRRRIAQLLRDRRDLPQRLLQVALDVGAERLQRRDVDHLGLFEQRRFLRLAHQRIDRDEERRQRLAGAGGRGDQRVAARHDLRPAPLLRLGRRLERALEPGANSGMEGI